MIAARPAVAAFGCRQCQSAIFRAVLSTSIPAIRTLPQRQARQSPVLARRLFSGKPTEVAVERTAKELEESLEIEEKTPSGLEEESSSADVPWFLDVEAPRHAQSQHAPSLPKVPEGAPAILEPMIKYVYEDMGLDDISLLDLRDIDPPAALGPNLIMLFGTARSERHLHISSGRFQRWLRRNHAVSARADGLIGPGELKTKLRRLRKKAKLMGTNTAILPGGDNGISTGWVCVNFSSTGDAADETASVDESGRFSGFGATQTGTTVVVQCMTESRRAELDLETLWQGILKRNIQANAKMRGEKSTQEDIEAMLASRVQLPTTPSALQWQALSKASQQRHYSTTARRLASTTQRDEPQDDSALGLLRQFTREAPQKQKAVEERTTLTLSQVQRHIQDLQLMGFPFTYEDTLNLIQCIFSARSMSKAATERLALVDQLFLSAEERGMDVWTTETFVTCIENMVTCPAYGPELQRAQANFEHILRQKEEPPNSQQIARLMMAFAIHEDWDKVWEAFRIPPRFGLARDPSLYELACRIMAATGNQILCINALRHVYPEMRSEEPAIMPTTSLFRALTDCISVADPQAESLLGDAPSIMRGEHNIPAWNHAAATKLARLQNREFLKVRIDAENWRQGYLAAMSVDE